MFNDTDAIITRGIDIERTITRVIEDQEIIDDMYSTDLYDDLEVREW